MIQYEGMVFWENEGISRFFLDKDLPPSLCVKYVNILKNPQKIWVPLGTLYNRFRAP